MGDEKGIQIIIQSKQSWQLVMCEDGRCPARAEHCKSVFLASSLRFPGVATSIACIICTVYCVILLKIINHDHHLTIPKD